jgi:hypothetical protein
MSSDSFSITRHKVPCQHIREYPKATAREQEDTLYLEVKQYIPLNNPSPQLGDVTIIAAHANGFPKVTFIEQNAFKTVKLMILRNRNFMSLFLRSC